MGYDELNLTIRKWFGVHTGDRTPYVGRIGTRSLLAKLLGELKFNRGAEIGVHQGGYSVELLNANPDLLLYSIDPWAKYSGNPRQAQLDVFYEKAKANLSKYPGCTIMREKSVEASKKVPDGSLDFVYIDAAHDFDNVMLDMLHWYPKVRKHGIFAGHDFWHLHYSGVIQAVEAFVRGHDVRDWYVTTFETTPSWFWVKHE